jgi:hypothetical protein
LNNELLPNQLPPLRHDRSDDLLFERALPVRCSLVADGTIELNGTIELKRRRIGRDDQCAARHVYKQCRSASSLSVCPGTS